MLTEKDYCNLEISDELRKLGYPKWPYEAMDMDSRLRIISLYEAQKFLREEKNIYVTVGCPLIMNEGLGWSYEVCDKPWNGHSDDDCLTASGGAYNSYEEALLKGIKVAIKLLKKEK